MANILLLHTEKNFDKNLINNLLIITPELIKNGHKCVYLGNNKLFIDLFEKNKWPLVYYDPNKQFLTAINILLILNKIYKDIKIDYTINLNNDKKLSIHNWFLKKSIKIFWLACNNELFTKKSILKRKLILKMATNTLIIANSRSLKNEFINVGIKKNNIITIPFTLNQEKYSLIKKNPLFANKGIITIGTIINSSENGIISLISAMQAVWNIIPNLYIVIINQGQRQPTLNWALKKAGIDSRTRIINKQNNTHAWIKAFDLLILPDKSPNFSYEYIFQAHYMKTAILTSNTGCYEEFVINNTSGLTYKSGNIDDLTSKIIKMYNNPKIMENIQNNAYDRLLKNYSISKIVQQYLDILQ